MTEEGPPKGVLERGLLLLSCFTQQTPRLHLRDLSQMSGLDKATTLRALTTLVKWHYLERQDNGAYSPGPANMRLASLFSETSNFIQRLEAPIAAISKEAGHTTSFFVRSADQRTCLARDRTHRDFRYYIEVGGSVPLSEGGAAARILLAYTEPDAPHHEEIRQQGRYISRGDRNRHLAAVGIPLFENDGKFLGAVTITGLAAELDDKTLDGFATLVHREMSKSGFLTSTA